MENLNEEKQPQTEYARLVFKHKELLYDIENYAFIEGDIMKTDDEHEKHQVFDIAQDGNVDRVTRMLNLAYTECVEMLYPYTKEDAPQVQDDLSNELTAPMEYIINLTLPYGFSMSTIMLLRNLVHEYLVCRVLEDWMSITNKKSQANWEEKMILIKSKIQTSLMSRTGKLKRKSSPF